MLEPDIAQTAAMIADSSRAQMLLALLGGKALTAGELAAVADITAPTASAHLRKLMDSHLIQMHQQGRHRYFQLTGPAVAELLESLLRLSFVDPRPCDVQTGPSEPMLRQYRLCYDHLAGALAVSLYDTLLQQEKIQQTSEGVLLTEAGERFFHTIGADIEAMKRHRRVLCRHCMDWSERRFHLAGALGAWIYRDLERHGWAYKALDSRVVVFNPEGLQQFSHRYGLK